MLAHAPKRSAPCVLACWVWQESMRTGMCGAQGFRLTRCASRYSLHIQPHTDAHSTAHGRLSPVPLGRFTAESGGKRAANKVKGETAASKVKGAAAEGSANAFAVLEEQGDEELSEREKQERALLGNDEVGVGSCAVGLKIKKRGPCCACLCCRLH